MAVREQTYRAYDGSLTSPRWRFLVVPRFAYQDVFQSRWFLATFVIAFVWPAVSVLLIYLQHNLEALKILNLRLQDLMPIDGTFFLQFFRVQGFFGFVLAFLVGPALIAPDLTHNGLALYLSRPFRRREYLLGKLAVLAIVLSLISWVPALLLFAFEAVLAGSSWLAANIWLVGAILAAAWVGILFIGLVTLALSAWIRWEAMARAVLLGIFALSPAVAGAINEIFETSWGSILNPGLMLVNIWQGLFRVPQSTAVPLWAAWATILVWCAVSLLLLARKVRAYEIVSG
jgi:ABC-2 type transport system permease protein